jgi:hypothetical protein
MTRSGGSSLFLFGYCVALTFTIVLQNNIFIKCLQCLCFLIAAIWMKQKPHILGVTILFFSTIILNLVVREGRVLFSLLALPITEEALYRGLRRGFTIISLFFMSKLLISTHLKLEGIPGRWLASTLSLFHFFTSRMKMIRIRSLTQDLDHLMIMAEKEVFQPTGKTTIAKNQPLPVWLLTGILAGNFALLIVHYSAILN